MNAKQYFAPIRKPWVAGSILVGCAFASIVLTNLDPAATRNRLGLGVAQTPGKQNPITTPKGVTDPEQREIAGTNSIDAPLAATHAAPADRNSFTGKE